MSDDKLSKKHELLYQENAKVTAIFWEWRHKVMTSFFAAIIAIFALSGWFYQQQFGWAVPITLFFGVILSIVALLLDRRNEVILLQCYSVGENLEKDAEGAVGIFSFIGKDHGGGNNVSRNDKPEKSDVQESDKPKRKLSERLWNIYKRLPHVKNKYLKTYTGILRLTYIVVAAFLLLLSGLAIKFPFKPASQSINVDAATMEKISKCLANTNEANSNK